MWWSRILVAFIHIGETDQRTSRCLYEACLCIIVHMHVRFTVVHIAPERKFRKQRFMLQHMRTTCEYTTQLESCSLDWLHQSWLVAYNSYSCQQSQPQSMFPKANLKPNLKVCSYRVNSSPGVGYEPCISPTILAQFARGQNLNLALRMCHQENERRNKSHPNRGPHPTSNEFQPQQPALGGQEHKKSTYEKHLGQQGTGLKSMSHLPPKMGNQDVSDRTLQN